MEIVKVLGVRATNLNAILIFTNKHLRCYHVTFKPCHKKWRYLRKLCRQFGRSRKKMDWCVYSRQNRVYVIPSLPSSTSSAWRFCLTPCVLCLRIHALHQKIGLWRKGVGRALEYSRFMMWKIVSDLSWNHNSAKISNLAEIISHFSSYLENGRFNRIMLYMYISVESFSSHNRRWFNHLCKKQHVTWYLV